MYTHFSHCRILLQCRHLADVHILSLDAFPHNPLTDTHRHPPPPPPADTAVFFCGGECERGSPSLCSGSLQPQSGQWKNPHPDRYHEGDREAELVRWGWAGMVKRQNHRTLPKPHNPLNVLS